MILPNSGIRRSSPCGSCLLEGVSWLRTTSDTRKDCGSAIRTGMAIKKIAIANSFKSGFISLFPRTRPHLLYAPAEPRVSSQNGAKQLLRGIPNFQLDFPSQRYKVPAVTAGGVLA